MENNEKDLYSWDKGLQQHDGVWYDSEFELKLNNAVRSGDVKGASEALKEDSELVKKIFGEDAEVEVIKEDTNMYRKGMLCKKKGDEKVLYFISPYVYDNEWQWSDSWCGWIVIPTAP